MKSAHHARESRKGEYGGKFVESVGSLKARILILERPIQDEHDYEHPFEAVDKHA